MKNPCLPALGKISTTFSIEYWNLFMCTIYSTKVNLQVAWVSVRFRTFERICQCKFPLVAHSWKIALDFQEKPLETKSWYEPMVKIDVIRAA